MTLPHATDPPAVWRAFAGHHASDARVRTELLASLDALADDARDAVFIALLGRARGGARREVLAAVERTSHTHALGPGVVYLLVDELLGGAERTRAVSALSLVHGGHDARDALSLAVSLAARVPMARAGGAHERAGLAAWVDAGGADPLRDVDAASAWRAWLDGRESPAVLDHALLLASAGAARAGVEQLRRVAEHVVEVQGGASRGAASLWRWLAYECVSDAMLPASVKNPAWLATAARALALTAIASAGHGAALRHVAQTVTLGAVERAVAMAVVRASLLDARRGPGDAAGALGDAVEDFARALETVSVSEPEYAVLVGLLLGREASGALVGAGRWLSDDLRARLCNVALANRALGAREVAFEELERHGAPAGVHATLREIAARDPDAVTRARAKLLERGARG